MRLPRALSGAELASLLSRHGYVVVRQRGSHLRLSSTAMGTEHRLTVPQHGVLRIGTLSAVLGDVADYLGIDREALAQDLFG